MQEDCTFDANFFGKNVTFVASKLSARGQFIFCLWSMSTTFSHNFKNITQNGQNHSCDTIALKRRYVHTYTHTQTCMMQKYTQTKIPIKILYNIYRTKMENKVVHCDGYFINVTPR